MRLIDADALINMLQKLFDKREKEQIFTGRRGVVVTWNDAIYHIKSAPTVDAVPVVRCRECELWNDWDHAGHKELGNFVCSCAYWSNEDGYVVYTAPDDYCSYGERKDGAEG